MKKSWLVGFLRLVFTLVTIFFSILYFIGCLLPWVSAKKFWFGGIIGLGYPYLVLSLILIAIIWIFIRKRIAFYLIILVCLGYKQLSTIAAINNESEFNSIKIEKNIRIISWNIANLNGNTLYSSEKSHSQAEVVESVTKQNADIICLQEFQECSKGCKGLDLLKKKYPFYYLSKWNNKITEAGTNVVIFSKFPIIKKDFRSFANGEAVIRIDIKIVADTISVFTTHLESFKFSKDEFKKIDLANANQNLNKKNTRGILSKLKHKLITHSIEADIVNKIMQTTNYPIILTGDFNEVSTNNTYWKLRGNKQDAFLEKGSGFGTTYNSLKNNLRIDFIFPDNNFIINQFKIVDESLSDHKMLVTDVLLKTNH